ncbi:hypothetical protein DM02DRAFT_649027 [Periconia macrospinosa]|uniref:HMG box domain-containing protein n=1 Tax=Periconia macrospinosa TaxID=97972 RepID=A0A2V1E986_9PLEO|nr:hypothetical protein DM02DRAFT_649027 [Periconia macrospinosa]
MARTYLRRKLGGKKGVRITRWVKLEDDRELKRPLNAFLRFSVDRRATNDFKKIPVGVSGKLVAEEWKALSASEKKKYEDEAAAERVEYERKFEQIYGHPAGSRSRSPSAT